MWRYSQIPVSLAAQNQLAKERLFAQSPTADWFTWPAVRATKHERAGNLYLPGTHTCKAAGAFMHLDGVGPAELDID